jgi:hypothetical protein
MYTFAKIIACVNTVAKYSIITAWMAWIINRECHWCASWVHNNVVSTFKPGVTQG